MWTPPSVFDFPDWRPFVAAWLAGARRAGWRVSWAALAGHLGVSVGHLRALRKSRRRLSRELALALGKALGLGSAERWQLLRLAALDRAAEADRPALREALARAHEAWRARPAPRELTDPRLAALDLARRGLLEQSPHQREFRGAIALTSPEAGPRLDATLESLFAAVQALDHPDGAPVTVFAIVLPLTHTLSEVPHAR